MLQLSTQKMRSDSSSPSPHSPFVGDKGGDELVGDQTVSLSTLLRLPWIAE